MSVFKKSSCCKRIHHPRQSRTSWRRRSRLRLSSGFDGSLDHETEIDENPGRCLTISVMHSTWLSQSAGTYIQAPKKVNRFCLVLQLEPFLKKVCVYIKKTMPTKKWATQTFLVQTENIRENTHCFANVGMGYGQPWKAQDVEDFPIFYIKYLSVLLVCKYNIYLFHST